MYLAANDIGRWDVWMAVKLCSNQCQRERNPLSSLLNCVMLHRRSTGPPRSLPTHSKRFCGGSTFSGPPVFVMNRDRCWSWLLELLGCWLSKLKAKRSNPAAKSSAAISNGYRANSFASSGNVKGSLLTLDCFPHTVASYIQNPLRYKCALTRCCGD